MSEGESRELFARLKKDNTSLHYIDEEDSVIPIESAWELEEAARLAKVNKKPIKLFLTDNKSKRTYTMYLNSNKNNIQESTFCENSSSEIPQCILTSPQEISCSEDAPPDWFVTYMKKFKKDLLSEIKLNIADAIENALKKKKKKSLLKEEDLCEKSEIETPDKVQTKKKKKASEKDFLHMDQELHTIKKFFITKSEKLQKLDSKSKLVLEEKRKILEKKRSAKSKAEKNSLESSEKKKLLPFSAAFAVPEIHLHLQPEKDFIVPLGVINNGTDRWRAPKIECFDFKEFRPDPLRMSIPIVKPGQRGIILLWGKACKTEGPHYFKCRILENMKVISPEFTCSATVVSEKPQLKQANLFFNNRNSNTVHSTDEVNNLEDMICSSERKIKENIKKIKEELHDLDVIEPSPVTFETEGSNGFCNRPRYCMFDRENKGIHLNSNEQEDFRQINEGTMRDIKSPYNMENLKDSLPQSNDENSRVDNKKATKGKEKYTKTPFNYEENMCERIDEYFIKGNCDTDYMQQKTPSCCVRDFFPTKTPPKKDTEEIHNDLLKGDEEVHSFDETASSSDSEAILVSLSEDEENFILLNAPSRSPSPAESVHEDKISVNANLEDQKPINEQLEPITTKKELSESKLKNQDDGNQAADKAHSFQNEVMRKFRESNLETRNLRESETPGDSRLHSLNISRSRRSPFGEEISKSKFKKMKSKSTEYRFTTANLTQPTFTVIPERVSAGPSQFIFTGEREEVRSTGEEGFEGKPSGFIFPNVKKNNSKKNADLTKRNIRNTDSVGRVIYAVNSFGCCHPVENLFETGENQKGEHSGLADDGNQTRCTRRNGVYNENPGVNILPHVLVNGASNVASLAFNTAKSVINNLQSAFVIDGKTEFGKPAFDDKKKVSLEEAMFTLYEMGFSDLEKNRNLLLEYEKDLRKVVGELVRQSKSSERPQ